MMLRKKLMVSGFSFSHRKNVVRTLGRCRLFSNDLKVSSRLPKSGKSSTWDFPAEETLKVYPWDKEKLEKFVQKPDGSGSDALILANALNLRDYECAANKIIENVGNNELKFPEAFTPSDVASLLVILSDRLDSVISISCAQKVLGQIKRAADELEHIRGDSNLNTLFKIMETYMSEHLRNPTRTLYLASDKIYSLNQRLALRSVIIEGISSLKNKGGFQSNAINYLIYTIGKNSLFHASRSILESILEMKDISADFKRALYFYTSNVYSRSFKVKDALRYFFKYYDLCDNGPPSYMPLLRLTRLNDGSFNSELAHKIYTIMSSSKGAMDVDSCSAMMSLMVDMGHPENALNMYHRFKSNGANLPNNNVYGALIRAYTKMDQLGSAWNSLSTALKRNTCSVKYTIPLAEHIVERDQNGASILSALEFYSIPKSKKREVVTSFIKSFIARDLESPKHFIELYESSKELLPDDLKEEFNEAIFMMGFGKSKDFTIENKASGEESLNKSCEV